MKKLLLSLAVSGALLSGWANDRALISDDYSNYFSTAKEIPLNMEISGSIETAGDIDIFKMTISKDDGLYFYGKSENLSGDIYVIKKETIEVLSDYLNESTWDIRKDVESNIKNYFKFSLTYREENKEGFNFIAGEYYIVVMGYIKTDTFPYYFKIVSEENNGSVSLDKVTLEYCKTHLEECGISVNSELKYTQSDLDSAVSSARTDERNQLKLSKEKIETLGSGWNLAGTSEAISTSELNGEIWSYENGSWSHNPNELKAFSGFWIKK